MEALLPAPSPNSALLPAPPPSREKGPSLFLPEAGPGRGQGQGEGCGGGQGPAENPLHRNLLPVLLLLPVQWSRLAGAVGEAGEILLVRRYPEIQKYLTQCSFWRGRIYSSYSVDILK